MHFDPTISLGNVLTIAAILAAIIRTDRQFYKHRIQHGIEHEMLISWYCRTTGIQPSDLPTRSK